MSDKNTIDFIGIGVVKSGTTWLAECLKEHPKIYRPFKKEICFFDSEKKGSNYSKGLKRYDGFFKKAKGDMIKGEFTTHYMFYPESSKLIKKHFPDVKLIACLRRPDDMAYSFYWWKKSNFQVGDLPKIFEKAVEQDSEYIERGMYYKQLKRYFDTFLAENIKIVLFDDIKNKPREILKEVYSFLGVDERFIPSFLDKKVNKTKTVRFKLLADLSNSTIKILKFFRLNYLVRNIMSSPTISNVYSKINKRVFNYPPMKPETRNKLKKYFREDIEKLEKLINRDLSAWK